MQLPVNYESLLSKNFRGLLKLCDLSNIDEFYAIQKIIRDLGVIAAEDPQLPTKRTIIHLWTTAGVAPELLLISANRKYQVELADHLHQNI